MSREGCSSLLVRTDEGYGIVTDTDLRGKVVAGGLPYDSTVRDVMTFPVRTVTVDRLVHEVLLDMLDADVHHLPVVDEEGRVMGVLSDTDILGLERRDPFSLRTQILRAGGREEVVRAGLMLPACIATLARVGLDPVAVGHVLSVLVDALTTRLLELAVNRLGDPPVPWAWLALGSEARREQALGTDQDHALAYANGGEEHDPYFARLAALVVEGLEGCGIRRCPSAVLASEDPWRQSVSGWVRTFEDWMGAHAAKPVFLTHIGFDYRAIAGPLEIESVLDDTVRSAKGRPEFLWRLARLALEVKPPLGFRGGLVVASAGGREGVLDIKAGGLMPVTDLARFFALEAGVAAKGTLERLGSAAEAGIIDEETRDALRDAYQVFLETRLSHQLAQVESGRPPDNLVDPSGLGQMSRARLKDAFRIVSHVQRELSRRLSAARIR